MRSISRYKAIQVTLLGWISMISYDFFLHGGLLSEVYNKTTPFLLSADEAFRFLPLGYASLLITAILLTWLMSKLQITTAIKGFTFGVIFGFLIWGAFVLGLRSISTADTSLLWGWFIGQPIELGIAGGVIGKGLGSESLKKLFGVVILILVISIVLTIILQSVGFATLKIFNK
jgi:hypothetical protein